MSYFATHISLMTTCRAFLRAGPAIGVLLLSWLVAGCDDGASTTGSGVVGDYPVAWVERTRPVQDPDNAGSAPADDDLRNPAQFFPGAHLMMKVRASPAAPVLDITAGIFVPGERYDVRDVTASFDGKKLLFALRGPYLPNTQDEDQPTWNIWEYDITTRISRRVITSDLVAEEGQDIMPSYLADGRIVFSSTRQRASRARLVDEGKTQFAMLDETGMNHALLLHVMNADGTDIHQITFNGSHDLFPTLLGNGRILFARQTRNRNRDQMNLYTVRPDGQDLQPAFGGASHDNVGADTVQFSRPHVLDDGNIVVVERPYTTQFYGGSLSEIAVNDFSDENQPLDGSVGLGGISPLALTIFPAENMPSTLGRYAGAVPLGDNTGRLLVSWSACRLEQVAAPNRIVPCAGNDITSPLWKEASPLYGLFVFDTDNGSRLPVVVPREGIVISDVAVAVPRSVPDYIPDATAGHGVDAALATEGTGILDIRSVYDFDGNFASLGTVFTSIAQLADPATATAAQRPARWLRLEKIVAIPDRRVRDFDPSAFGVTNAFGMREIVGYAPVEPDGSVRVKVPANVPMTFSVVDARGMRIGARHNAWVQVMPGEERECAGCHTNNSRLPHGRNDSGVVAANHGALGGAPFANTRAALVADAGETMAQTRSRIDVGALQPSIDMLYSDLWTDPAVRAPDADDNRLYANLTTTQPASPECQARWLPACRSIINYEENIHPLWAKDRPVFAADGVTVIDDNTCTNCHSSRDPAGVLQFPAGQLDLTDLLARSVATRMNDYQDLLAQDNEQVVLLGSLTDKLVQDTDANGNPLFVLGADGSPVIDSVTHLPTPVMVPVPISPPMVAGSAAVSSRFFSEFTAGGSHQGRLSPEEIRLLIEWVDLGAQYYNDPFLAPLAN